MIPEADQLHREVQRLGGMSQVGDSLTRMCSAICVDVDGYAIPCLFVKSSPSRKPRLYPHVTCNENDPTRLSR